MGVYRMDPLEIAGGWVNGYDPVPFPPPTATGPRRVLDRILLRHLQRSPCLVAFSGGRDSSVVLAAAVAAARREGLALPIPVTLSYPAAPESNETAWQHTVLDHLGISERVTLTVHDEHDPIGPVAAPLLRDHGVVWSPNFAPTWRMLDLARGGVLLTGEGGDELFGLKRITPLTKTLKVSGRVRPAVYQDVAQALAPSKVREHLAMRRRYRRPWLREPVDALLARRDAADAAAYALHAGRNAWQFSIRRCARRSYESLHALGAEIGAEYVQTFAEPELVTSVATAAGFWGWSGRTATMRHLFDDLLPQAVFERTSKAVFTNAVFTEYSREFARGWTGAGVDTDLVDPGALRENWLSGFPHAPSMALLQQAWLASDRTVRSA